MSAEKILFNRQIIVYTPSFDQEKGGVVVLHYLVDRLRSLNIDAYAMRVQKKYPDNLPIFLKKLKHWNYHVRKKFKTHPGMNVPVLKTKINNEAVIIYPEVVDGNPLGAKHVVRWLLHKPGFFGVGGNYADDDEIFYYAELSRDIDLKIPKDNYLHLTPLIQSDYFDYTSENRKGSCRLIRKGAAEGEVDLLYGGDAILLDGKSHAEIAKIFRNTKYFLCHDTNTFFFYLAALSGCIPIVVPQPGVTSGEWRKGAEFKFGIAYGVEEIEWAKKTRITLLEEVQKLKKNDEKNLISFLNKLYDKFG